MTKTPDGIEVIEVAQLGGRRRFTAEEKRRLVAEALSPGSSVSLVARRNGISSNLLFRWRRLMEQGELESLGADEQVVPASEAQEHPRGSLSYFPARKAGLGPTLESWRPRSIL
jgi:transposase